jgi:hypothetical protein
MAATVSYREYQDVFSMLGLADIFPPHLRKFWSGGVPAGYAVACLKSGVSVSQTIELWDQGVPLEYAAVA